MSSDRKSPDANQPDNRSEKPINPSGSQSGSQLSDAEKLKNLGDKVDKARLRQQPDQVNTGRGSAIGLAYRLSVELVVGVLVGAFIGWWMDKWFSTAPLFLLVMLVLGMVAGVVNMMRTSREMHARMGAETNGNGDDDNRSQNEE